MPGLQKGNGSGVPHPFSCLRLTINLHQASYSSSAAHRVNTSSCPSGLRAALPSLSAELIRLSNEITDFVNLLYRKRSEYALPVHKYVPDDDLDSLSLVNRI